MNLDQILTTVTDVGLRVALQVVGALVVFIVGRRLIDLSVRLVSAALTHQHYWQVDANRAVAAAFGEAGFPAPATVIATRA